MRKLISEVFIDPTHVAFFMESGEALVSLDVNYTFDYDTTRILRVYNSPLADAPPTAKLLPVTESKVSISDCLIFYELVDFSSEDDEIYFSVETDESGEVMDLFIYSKTPLILLKENFCFAVFSQDLHIVDKYNKPISTIKNPKTNDDDYDVNEISIEYFGSTLQHENSYFITGLLKGYAKPLFTDNLETCRIELT